MKAEALRTLALAHGIVAWLATALLLWLGFVLVRKRFRHTRLYAALVATMTGLLVATGATGALLDLPYRSSLRQRLFLASHALGFLLERKLHFAFGALAFAAIGLSAFFAEKNTKDESARKELSRATTLGFVASASFALAAAIASSVVAARMRF